ncbi:HAMP domain-containing protein [Lysinibacillus sp. MHQ-1]|nr:HAMP domain-containing protein [Lysinibacillus sp. MHQ-1]
MEHLQRSDEIGQLNEGFNEMVDQLKNTNFRCRRSNSRNSIDICEFNSSC